MLLAWAAVLATHFLAQIFFSGWGRATDVSASLFYSGVLALLSAVTVVPLLTWGFGRLQLPVWAYPLATAAAALLVLGGLLRLFSGPALGLFSLPFGLLGGGIGLLFGLVYLRLTGHGLAPGRPALALVAALAGLALGRAALLAVAPVWSYQHLGQDARQELAFRAISALGTGQPVQRLNERLPGFVPPNLPPNGTLTANTPGLQYELRFSDGLVTGMWVSR